MSRGAVLMVDKRTGAAVRRFGSAAEAARATGRDAHSIRRCARTGGPTRDAFYWRHPGDDAPIAYMRCVVCTEEATGAETVFPCAREAAIWLGCTYAAVRQALSRRSLLAGAFTLRYA